MVLSRPALVWVACLTLLTTLVSGLTSPIRSTLAQSGGAAPTAAAANLDPGRLVVVLKDSTSASGTYSAASAYDERSGVAITHRYTEFVHGFSGQFNQTAINDLVKDPNVAAIYPDYPVYPASQDLPTGTDRVDADLNPTKAGDGHYAVDVDVAIFDTGVYKHSDLNVVGGKDCTPGGSNPYNDVYGHGTAVAGIIGAKDNTFGVVGIAPGARLWALKVAGEDGLAYASNVMCAQDWMASHTFIKVINYSFAGPDGGFKETCSDGYVRSGFCHLTALGITTFVAAGNDATDASDYAPAEYPEVITISAITDYDGKPGGLSDPGDDEFASFSNYGSVVDLAAPGTWVETTSAGGGYEYFTGTSGASPNVAGAAALIVAQQGLSGRDLILQRLILSSQPGAIPGDPDRYHEPLINVAQLGVPRMTMKSSAYPGDQIRVSVAAFLPGGRVTFRYDSTYIGGATVGADGKASLTFAVPASKSGPHSVTVSNTRKTIIKAITVKPKIWSSSSNTVVGGSIKATMKGYQSGEHIAVTLGGRTMGSATASSSGTATLTFVVPAMTGGAKSLRGNGSGGSGSSVTVTVKPSMTLDNPPVGASTPAHVTLRGFGAGEVVTFRLDHSDGPILGSKTMSSTGSGSATVDLSSVTPGAHDLYAVGDGGSVVRISLGLTTADEPVTTPSPSVTSTATAEATAILTATEAPQATETATSAPMDTATAVPTETATAIVAPTETSPPEATATEEAPSTNASPND